MTLEEKHARLDQLGRDLRAALANGCPAWLVEAAHHCATELERLAMYDAPDSEIRAAGLQAEALIEVCRASSSKRSLSG